MPSQAGEWTAEDFAPTTTGQWTAEDFAPRKPVSTRRPIPPLSPEEEAVFQAGIQSVEPTGLLGAFAGSVNEGLRAVPELARLAGEKMSTAPMYGGVGSLIESAAGGVSGFLKGAAEEADPPERRGPGGLPEDLARGLGSIVGAAPGMALGPAGAALQFGAQSGVPLYYEVKQSTGDEEAALWALLGGAALGQLERFGVEGLLGKAVTRWAGGPVGQELVKRLTQRALGIGAAGVGEAGTELAQQAGEDLLFENLTGEDVENIERLKRALPPALILGTGFGALVESVDAARARGQQPRTDEALPAAPTDVARPAPAPGRTVADIGYDTAPGTTSELATGSGLVAGEPTEAPGMPQETTSPEPAPEAQEAPPAPTVDPTQPTPEMAASEALPTVEEETRGPDLPEPQLPLQEEAPSKPSAPKVEEAPKATGIKNAAVERELEEMGLPLPKKAERRTFVDLHAEAKATLEAKPDAGRNLVEELEAAPRPPTDAEDAILTFEANRLKLERQAAEDAYIENPTQANKDRIERAKADFKRAADVFDRVGTESGRSLNARKLMLAEDYSLAAMERAYQVAKGGDDLTAKESARVKELQKELEAAVKAHGEYVTAAEMKQASDEAEKAMLRLQLEAKRGVRRAKRTADVEQAKKDLASALDELGASMRLGSTGGNVNVKALAKAASAVIRIGGKTFAQFADDMVARFGEAIRPYLRPAWDAAEGERRKGMAAGLKGKTKPEDVHRGVHKIALDFVESGITDRDALTKAVHGVVREVNPAMTLEETRDAISGYGIFRPLSKGEAKKKLRDLKGQMQQVAKLEALKAKEAVKKTGFERQEPSPTQKRLAKQVRDQQKFLRLKPVDTAKADAKAIEAAKTRVRTRINELEQQIAARQMGVKRKGKVRTDPALVKLREELAATKEDFEGQFKAELAAEMEASRLKALKTRLRNEIADLEARVAAKDFTDKPKPKPVAMDPEAVRLAAEREQSKRKFEREKEKARLAQRNIAQKALDGAKEILDLPRALLSAYDFSAVRRQGGFFTSAHPLRSAGHAKRMFAAWAKKQIAADVDQEIRARPGYALGEAAGLELTSADGALGPAEEALRSRLSDKIPGIMASNRAYITYLNLQRAAAFDTLIEAHPGTPTLDEAKQIAAFVNRATGRSTGKGAKMAQRLEGIKLFWAPSYVISRFQLMFEPLRLALPGKGMTWAVRKAIGKELLKYITGQAVYYGLLGAIYAAIAEESDEEMEIGTDFTSSDFGKIRVGDTRVDPLSGLAQVATFFARFVSGTSTKRGKRVPLSETKDKSRYGLLLRFARSKYGPLQGRVANALAEENLIGEEMTPAEALLEPPIPLSFDSTLRVAKDLGIPATVITQALSMLGDGVQSYSDKKK